MKRMEINLRISQTYLSQLTESEENEATQHYHISDNLLFQNPREDELSHAESHKHIRQKSSESVSTTKKDWKKPSWVWQYYKKENNEYSYCILCLQRKKGR